MFDVVRFPADALVQSVGFRRVYHVHLFDDFGTRHGAYIHLSPSGRRKPRCSHLTEKFKALPHNHDTVLSSLALERCAKGRIVKEASV